MAAASLPQTVDAYRQGCNGVSGVVLPPASGSSPRDLPAVAGAMWLAIPDGAIGDQDRDCALVRGGA